MAGAPTSWAGVAAALARDATEMRARIDAGDTRFENLAAELARQAQAAAFLAGCGPEARAVALRLWRDNGGGLSAPDVATITAGVLSQAERQ